MNLTLLTQMASQFAGDPGLSRYAGRYTDALNLAQQQFVLDTKCLWKYQTSTTVANQAAYDLPTDFLFEKDCTLNGLPLKPASKHELARANAGTRWDTRQGTPTHYVTDPEVNTKDLILYPIPQGADAGKDILLTYFAYPTDMAGGSDLALNGNTLLEQFRPGLAAWAAWYLIQSEEVTDKIEAKKRDLHNIYNDCVSNCVDTFKVTSSEPIRMRGVRAY